MCPGGDGFHILSFFIGLCAGAVLAVVITILISIWCIQIRDRRGHNSAINNGTAIIRGGE